MEPITTLPQPYITQLGEVQNTPIFQPMPYDNDVTLLYKWAEVFQVPVRIIVVRPRTPNDNAIVSGTPNYIFESLPLIVQRLSLEGETPAGIYDIITGYKPLIKIDDIMMSYFDQLKRENIQSEGTVNPNLYITINQVYREMDNTLVVDKFESLNDLQRTYDSWYDEIRKELIVDMRRLESINDIQFRLAEVDQQPKIPFSPVSINSTIMAFNPTINGRPVNMDDGPDIFNDSFPSRYVPFIRYNDKYGKSLSRVYTGGKIENEPNYSVTVISPNDASAKNAIYMTLWLGDPNNDGSSQLHDANRESFFTVVYYLESNYLTVESPVGTDPKKGLIRNEQLAYQRTQSALPNLNFGIGKEIKVRGEFNIWGMAFDETPFVDMVLLEPIMNVYLYIEENIKPFALKKRLDVHYRSIFTDMGEGKTGTDQAYIANSASVSVTLNQKITEADEVINVLDPVSKQIVQAKLPAGVPYIHVNISQAESRNAVDGFLPIFRLLMRYYLDNQQPIADVYNAILPELAALGPLLEYRKRKFNPEQAALALAKEKPTTKRAGSKIKRLQEKAPDLFVLNYARRCQCQLQPIIIEPEEIEFWKQKRVGPTQEERQVMPFPKLDLPTNEELYAWGLAKRSDPVNILDARRKEVSQMDLVRLRGVNPRLYIVCPDDENPYPGVKVNTDLPNRDIYPYVPCCRGRDQMSPGVNSRYRDYVENKPLERKVGAKAEKKISTRKILVPDKIAFLPRAVENIVKRYSDEYIDMVRYGVIYTPNSLLHCICVAIDDPNYLALQTEAQKEAYVTRIRQHMLATIKPSLLKQELYDYTDEEIMDIFRDNSKFLDPSLFYRAVEETFNINIYVFTPPAPKGDETELGAIDIPRFKIFHSRPLRLHRPTVVLMKMSGSESDALDYPKCELIVDYDEDNLQIMKLFGPEMTEVCHSALQDTLKTMTWNVFPNNTFEVHSNIYYYIDHLSLFQVPPVSQFIDDNGKMRALTLNLGKINPLLPDGPTNTQYLTIATIPSQPENIPVSSDFHRVPAQLATQIFGEPTGVTRDNSGNADGLWFRIMDINYGEYVPITPVAGFNDKPIGPPNPISSSGQPVTHRLSKLRRTLNIITQLVRWLYELARSRQNIDPKTFSELYMVMDINPVADSATYYNLTGIPRLLPIVETIQEAIAILEPLAPTLFNQGRIIMYTSSFADLVVKMLKDYDSLYPVLEPMTPDLQNRINQLCMSNTSQSVIELRDIAVRLKIPNPHSLNKIDLCNSIRLRYKDSIDNYYETESDFTSVPNSKLFMNEKDLKSWLSSLKSSQNYSKYFNIRDKIEIAMGFSLDPYMYKDDDGKVYIIQNVVGGLKSKALTIANNWYTNKVNLGSDPEPSQTTPIHMIYGISPASKLIPIEDQTRGSNIFLSLLYYGSQSDKMAGKDGRYGAILEIL